jgi:hypothetical protein
VTDVADVTRDRLQCHIPPTNRAAAPRLGTLSSRRVAALPPIRPRIYLDAFASVK